MNGYGDENISSCCYFHPKEAAAVGVCPLCLNEKLLILASKQGHAHHHHSSSSSPAKLLSDKKSPAINNLPKIFAFGSVLLHRFEFRRWKSGYQKDDPCSSSEEDSFISMEFEENGAASWEKGAVVSEVSMEHCSGSSMPSCLSKKDHPKKMKSTQILIEHAKPRASAIRWRKRIGHMLQLLRLKRSGKVAVEAGGGGVKVMRKGWIKTVTKRGAPRNKGIL